MSRHSDKQTVITWTPVTSTNPARKAFPEIDYHDSLVQPEHIEFDGAEWSVKLQDTFLVDSGKSILAIWAINKYLRDTLETQIKQIRGAAWHYRKSGEFNHAQYQEEVVIAMERDYPHIKTDGLAFKGLTIL